MGCLRCGDFGTGVFGYWLWLLASSGAACCLIGLRLVLVIVSVVVLCWWLNFCCFGILVEFWLVAFGVFGFSVLLFVVDCWLAV